MDYRFFKKSCLPCLVLAWAFALSGCTDGDYDFNDVDVTVGLGGDGLTLPVNSTDTIKLADVLELEGDECVVVRPNGDYVFEQRGNDVEPAHPEIGVFTVSQREVLSTDIDVDIVPVQANIGEFRITAGGQILSFTYDGEKPDEVISLDNVGVSSALSLDVVFPDVLSALEAVIDEVALELPSFMVLGDVSANFNCRKEGSRLIFTDVLPADGLHLRADVNSFDFNVTDTSLGSISISDGKILLDGRINASIDATVGGSVDLSGVTGGKISASLRLDDINITSATGRFNPTINLDNLGSVNVTGVPEFLTDGNVVVDLYNPQIYLDIDNDMNVAGYIGGTITATKNGAVTASVAVPEFHVNGGGVTNVCICRRDEGISHSEYEVVVVPELSDIIRTIPDNISFAANARADEEQTSTFEFGRSYNVKPNYSVVAPITFAEDARIVYTDTLDGWNDDINDFELADNSSIEATAVIENRVPAYLSLQVDAIDADGNIMSADDIVVESDVTVLASPAEGQSAETPLTLRIQQNRQGALSRLDGLVLRIEGSAAADGQSAVVGQTLNAQKHFIIARDIKVSLVGKIIGDFN